MTDGKTVDVQTDNLDDFSDLLFGKATEAPPAEAEVDEPVSEIEDPSASDEENETLPEASAEDDSDGEDGPADDVDEDEDEEPEEVQKPRKKSARERINELTAKARQAERDLEDLRRRLEERDVRQPEPAKDPIPSVTDGMPDPDELDAKGQLKYPMGEFDPLYIRDLSRFEFLQQAQAWEKDREEKEATRQRETAEQALLKNWDDKVADASERLSDFLPKVALLEDTFRGLDPQKGTYLATTIMAMDYGPDVLNYLADNIDEARNIVAAGPTQATIALGRIEAKFLTPPKSDEAKKKSVTKASAPPPANKGSSVAKAVSPDTDDLDAFEKQFFK